MGHHVNRVLAALLIGSPMFAHAAGLRDIFPWRKKCVQEFSVEQFNGDLEALETVNRGIQILRPDAEAILQQGRYYLSPRERWKSNLATVAFYGGANEGKSSLFNALRAMFYNYGRPVEAQDWTYGLEQPVSATGITAGLTKRTLVAMNDHQVDNAAKNDLDERLPDLQIYEGPLDPTDGSKKTPIIFAMKELPPNLAVLDALDITSGDPRVNRDPLNLKMAERTLVAADVMLVVMDIRTANNPAILNSIRDTFARYGRKQMIPVLQADANVSEAEALAHLNQFANIAYDRPVGSVGTPEGVIGMYVMPIDARVRTGQAHVSLKPVGGSLEFVELMLNIANNSKGYKEAALRAATENYRMESARIVREEYKSRLVAQIYYEAVEALRYAVASDQTFNLEYDQRADYWRTTIEDKRAVPMPLLNRGAEIFGKPEKALVAGYHAARKLHNPNYSAAPQINFEKLVLYNRNTINDFQNQLNSRFLNLIRNPDTPNRRAAGDQLFVRIEEFRRLFPEERSPEDQCNAHPGRICVHLPRRELLPAGVREEFERYLTTNVDQQIELVSQLEVAALNPDSKEAQDALVRIKDKRKFGHFVRDAALDVATIGLFFGVTGGITGYWSDASWAVLPAVVLGQLSARAVRQFAENSRDKTYQPLLNHWFRQRQWSTIDRVFKKHLAANLSDSLKAASEYLRPTLEETLKALRHLDPSLPQYPAELRLQVSHEEAAVAHGS